MEPRAARPGWAPLAAGGFLLAQLAAAAALLRASGGGVTVAGIPLDGVCLFRRLTGFACPTCGMTRSIALTLQGDLAAAFRMNPAGILWVLAVAAIGVSLVWLGLGERTQAAARRVRTLAVIQGVSVGVVLAVHWIHGLLH